MGLALFKNFFIGRKTQNTNYLETLFGEHKKTGFELHYLTLYSLVVGLESKKTFEFGTGFSTNVILEALKITKGDHISNDVRPIEKTQLSKKILLKDNYRFIQDDSSNLSKYVTPGWIFDFCLHDGTHEPQQITKDLDFILPKMKFNSIVAIHDTEDNRTKTSKEFRDVILAYLNKIWPECSVITLPYGFGLTLIRMESPVLLNNGNIELSWKKK